MQDTVFQGWTENIGNYGAKMVERFGDWFKPVYNDGRTNNIVAEGTTRGTNLIGGTGVTQWWNKGPDGVYRAMTEAGFRTDVRISFSDWLVECLPVSNHSNEFENHSKSKYFPTRGFNVYDTYVKTYHFNLQFFDFPYTGNKQHTTLRTTQRTTLNIT